MADVLSRACQLCLGVYLGAEMLEFSIVEHATKSRRTIQICGTCAGNIADAVYNLLTAADQEAKGDAATASDHAGSADSAAPGPATTGAVVLEGESRDRGLGEHRAELRADAGSEGVSQPAERTAEAGGVEESTGVEK